MVNLWWTQLFTACLILVITLVWHCCKRKTQRFKATVVVKRKPQKPEPKPKSELVDSRVDEPVPFKILSLSADIQLISATKADSSGKGIFGKSARVDGVFEDHPPDKDKQNTFITYFDYDKNFGTPGAFYIKNLLPTEFFLVSLTLENIHNHENIHFVCKSWIYNENTIPVERIFFTNNTYLLNETPPPLEYYRQKELQALRGPKGDAKNGKGMRKEGERIYDYDVYNDLGDPAKKMIRPICGGSSDYPYPRRGRTGRDLIDNKYESKSKNNYVYIPRDEDVVDLPFKHLLPKLQSAFQTKSTKDGFDSLDHVFDHQYNDQGDKLPVPQVIQVSKTAWSTDEEFAREVLAGVNPCLIRRVQEIPPSSKLYSGEHRELKLDGRMTVSEAIKKKKYFVLDDHDLVMPYLRRINSTPTRKGYASKTYFYLRDNGTLTPVRIELSLPNPKGDQFGVDTQVYYPDTTEGTAEAAEWLLAKAYVIVNDSCFHQLISHWLHTHAVVEPFVIATNRHLSVLHPIYKLLQPHFRNTMNINAAARQSLIAADTVIEKAFMWGEYAVEMSSVMYKDWVFLDQALPEDLRKRGMLDDDDELVIKDYPYAVDGLKIWNAIKTWVEDYVSIYYTSDEIVKRDSELQSWWKEIVEVGHGDKKDDKRWPKMQTLEELKQTCTIIIWIASALHAAVNFGQYPYGGYIPNRPTLTTRFIPERDTDIDAYNEMVNHPLEAYLKTIPSSSLAGIIMPVLFILSTHLSDEYYLGQNESDGYWTSDTKALKAFKDFGTKLSDIGKEIMDNNKDEKLKNRVGPVVMPYTLLYPISGAGTTFKGIPNSISI